MPLEIFHFALVLLGGRASLESTEIAALAGPGNELARIEPVLAGSKLADHDGLSRNSCRTSGQVARWFQFSVSEAKIGDIISALVLDRHRTFHPLQRLLGVLVAEVGGALVIGLGGCGIL